METFTYKAISSNGKEKKGSIDAESKQDAIKKLKENGYIPMEVVAQSALDKDISFSPIKKKVKARDLSVFCRQFSSILRAGVNMINALDMIGDQTENKILRNAIRNCQSFVEKGGTLSEGMKIEKDAFPNLLVSMVAAGEASGSLDIAIERMAIQFEKDAKITGMVKRAMTYPIVLLCVMLGVIILMLTYVIPQFSDMFASIDSELPAYTLIILYLSDFIKGYWYVLILAVAGIIVAYKAYYKTNDGKHRIDALKLKIPVFGDLAVKTACSRFSRTLATLLQSGMPMMEALRIVTDIMGNILFKDAIEQARTGVSLGFDLSGQLNQSGLFPKMIVHMTNIGEETGNMEEMLTNVANYYDEEVEATTQQATSLMEPLIIVLMAVVVLILVLTIYGPMMQLYRELG